MIEKMKTIRITAGCECPFQYTTEGESQDETWYPGDDMCTLRTEEDDEECQGFCVSGCPLEHLALVCVMPEPVEDKAYGG